jgi:hypothetical protein
MRCQLARHFTMHVPAGWQAVICAFISENSAVLWIIRAGHRAVG